MKSDAPSPDPAQPPKRAYRQGARAEAAAAAGQRMAEAFLARLQDHWFEDIRLEDVARDAGVSVQTLIRRFGGKDGLLEAAVQPFGVEVMARRKVSLGDVAGALKGLIEDYELSGDMVLRMLAQEDRHPAVRRATDFGRAGHRQWLAETFAPNLDALAPEERRRRLDALVAVTDVYVWKLIRRDMGRPVDELFALMQRLVPAALAGLPVSPSKLEPAQ